MNEASWDRIVRVTGGVALVALGLTALSGGWAVAALVTGVVFTITGAIGWCPIYGILRTGTRKTSVGT